MTVFAITIPTPDPQTHTHSEWTPAVISGSIAMFKLHQAMNQGEAVIIKYLEEKKQSAMTSMTEVVADEPGRPEVLRVAQRLARPDQVVTPLVVACLPRVP